MSAQFQQFKLRTKVLEMSGGHAVVADGVSPWLPERYTIFEVQPGFWTDQLAFRTLPG